jgi:F-type H+-transporting ATPase subunit b
LTRTLRHAVLLCLLGICVAGVTTPRLVWAQGGDQGAKEQKDENRELIYKTINFAILVVALGYILRKPAAEFFSSRSGAITKGLDEGRKALEASQARLQEVEAKLSQLEAEIAAFKDSSIREMEAERARLKQAGAEEATRILDSARAQTESAVRAARLELKSYAATKSVALAEELIRARLDDAAQQRLVKRFVDTVNSAERKN